MGFALVVKAAAAAAAAAATVPLPPIAPRQHHFQLQLRVLPSNNSTEATRIAARSTRTTTTSSSSRCRRWRQSPTRPSTQALPPLLQRPPKLSTTNKQQPHPPISTTPETKQPSPDTSSISSDGEGVVPNTCTATDVLDLMDGLQLPIEADLYLSLVKECIHSRDAVQGAKVHAHIQRSRPRLRRAAGLPLANRLLLMYATCGQPDIARQMFDRMPLRDAMSWAAMIAALAHHGGYREALRLFTEMRESVVETGGRYSDDLVLVTTLRSCVRARELGLARQVHGLALKVLGESGAIGGCGGIGSSLLQCYSMLGCHQSARSVFERIRIRSRGAAAWTCMITGCCREGRFEEALYVFREMGRAGNRRNRHVVSSILAACARFGDGGWGGGQVHANAVKIGVDADRYVGSSLVDMYARHGLFKDARRAFEAIAGSGDPVCWNAMLAGYARGGCCSDAIRLLYDMRAAGIRPMESIVIQVRMACSG